MVCALDIEILGIAKPSFEPMAVRARQVVDDHFLWCPGRESNPYGRRPRDFKSLVSTSFTTRAGGSIDGGRRRQKRESALALSLLSGAAEESRTLDLNLGKVALYQLSYCRVTVEARAGVEPTYTDLQSGA